MCAGMAPSVGIIIGSTRPNCNGKVIATWLHKLIRQDDLLTAEYTLIDLVEWNLPLFNEPGIPMKVPASLDHSKAWSQHIKALDGFVFVTPQVLLPLISIACLINFSIVSLMISFRLRTYVGVFIALDQEDLKFKESFELQQCSIATHSSGQGRHYISNTVQLGLSCRPQECAGLLVS